MKKNTTLQWSALLLVLAACAAGFFLRRQQLATELLSDGSLAAGSRLHTWLWILALATAVLLAVLLFPLIKQRSWRSMFLHRPALNLFQLPAAVGLIVGNILILLVGRQPTTALAASSPKVSQFLSGLLAPMGLLCALCLAAFAICCLYQKRPSPLLYIASSLYLVVRLIVCFQEWNTDPSIHDYCYQLLAAICCMLGSFQLAGFSFDRGKRRITLFWVLLAMLFCSVTVADSYHKGSSDEILINLSLLVSMTGSALQLLFCSEAAEQQETAEPEKAQPENETPAEETQAKEETPAREFE